MSVLHKQPHHCTYLPAPVLPREISLFTPVNGQVGLWTLRACIMPTHLRLRFPSTYAPPSCDLIFLCQIVGKGRRVIVMTANIYIILNHLWYKSYYSYLMDEEIEAEIKLSMFTQSYKWWSQDSNTGILGPSRVYAIEHQALLYISVLPAFSLGLLSQYALPSVCCHHWPCLQLLPPAPSPLLLC